MADARKVGEPFNPKEAHPEMVGFTIPFPIASDRKLSHCAKLLYGHLRWRCSPTGECFPSVKDMLAAVGLRDERNMRRVLVELQSAKLIRLTERIDEPSGRRTTNRVEFLWTERLLNLGKDSEEKRGGEVQGTRALGGENARDGDGENARTPLGKTPGTGMAKKPGLETSNRKLRFEASRKEASSVRCTDDIQADLAVAELQKASRHPAVAAAAQDRIGLLNAELERAGGVA